MAKYSSLATEVSMLGAPIVGGSLRFNLPLKSNVSISSLAGFGVTVGYPISVVGIFGVQFSYFTKSGFEIFLEPKIFLYPNKLISIGKGFWGIDTLNEQKPFVLSWGIGF